MDAALMGFAGTTARSSSSQALDDQRQGSPCHPTEAVVRFAVTQRILVSHGLAIESIQEVDCAN